MPDTRQLTIDPIAVPSALDAPDAGPFLAIARIGNAVCRHDAGHPYLDQDPAEVLGYWQETTYRENIGFAAAVDGDIVGVATAVIPREADTTALEFDVMVDPPRWGEGVEGALLRAIEDTARERGRTVVQTYTLHRPDTAGERLVPSTGWGAVPAHDRQTEFMLANGFTLEQVERNSALDLAGSLDLAARMFHEATAFAGADYRLLTWTSPTPDAWVDGFADIIARMATDVPQGGMVIEEETWDAARVRSRDARMAAQQLLVSVAAVEHVPSGRLVAYNELVIGPDRSAATQQYGTLVVKEHRGRRLGTIVKTANILRWRELVPESPRISTFNAEENRPMLDINEAIGFVPASYAGAWKKVLDA